MVTNNPRKIRATLGREDAAGERYVEIRDLIKGESQHPFKDVILKIADIDKGTFYNYTAKNSRQFGCVSLHTAQNMAEFFGLPIGIFDCSQPLTELDKDKIREVVRNHFGKVQDCSEKNVEISLTPQNIMHLAQQLSVETNVNVLEKVISDLETICEIASNRLNTLHKMEKILGGIIK